MIRINYVRQLTHLLVYLLIQLPILYEFILFDRAFGFFYIGFILFLPLNLNRNLAMVIALFSGLLVDVFSNTPGIHASACVFIALARDYWHLATMGESDDDPNFTWNDLGIWGFIKFILPLIFAHNLIIFTIENGGFGEFFRLMNKVILSSLYSFVVILGISLLIAPKKGR